MKTESILLQNLCVPCGCRCRYCLLSWDGKTAGVPWEQGAEYALRFRKWLAEARPELGFQFAFGYSMEHPQLREALRFLRRIGSPQAEYLQCDGMKLRDEESCRALTEMLAEEGVRQLNFTCYGLSVYHDRFAGRQGDFALLLRMMRAALETGIGVSAGIPLTAENAAQADELVALLCAEAGCRAIRLFVPHGEGRGRLLEPIRLTERDLLQLSPETGALLNRELYRSEREWLTGPGFREETQRSLLLTLGPDRLGRREAADFAAWIAEAEALDEAYYAAYPTLPELAERYGDPEGGRLFRQRDLFHYYRRRYAEDFGVSVYDVCDERRTGSRRF